MAEISHLIADPDTNAKLKACFPDFSLLKEEVKKKLLADLGLAQALIVSPEISDVPEPSRFLFLLSPQADDRSQISCRGYCYLGDRERFLEYLKTLLESSAEIDIDNPIYIANFHKIDPAQIFSSLSLVYLREEVAEEKNNQLRESEKQSARVASKHFSQLAFIALIVFTFVYGYSSPQAQILINRTRNYVFGVTSFLTGVSEPGGVSGAPVGDFGLEMDSSTARARFVGEPKTEEETPALEPSDPRDRIDLLMGKLELLENQDKARPEEIEQIEAEIDKAFEVFADKEVVSKK